MRVGVEDRHTKLSSAMIAVAVAGRDTLMTEQTCSGLFEAHCVAGGVAGIGDSFGGIDAWHSLMYDLQELRCPS